jgi:hypothetical protein
VPGAAHAATFWGFTVLLLTIIESYGALFDRTFCLPWIGHWAFIGFIEDLFAVGVLAGIITFTVIRLRNNPLGYGVNSVLEVTLLLAQVAVVLVFLVIVVYSKHLHIFLAPVNVLFSRRPNGLGPLEPMRSGGKVLDFEEADPDTDVFGLGKIEDFTWKGLLDMGTCTECGRCQSQCPAWATGKPLNPKQVILGPA